MGSPRSLFTTALLVAIATISPEPAAANGPVGSSPVELVVPTAPPLTSEPPASVPLPRALTRDQCDAVYRRGMPAVSRCLSRGPRVAGQEHVRIELTIAPSGSVSAVGVRGDVSAEAQACVEQAARGWVFPASRTSVVMSWSMTIDR